MAEKEVSSTSTNGSGGDGVGQGVAFATLRPTFSDCSAQLVDLMRNTLRHAQEIGAVVGEAENTSEHARAAVAATRQAETEQESRSAEAEIKRLTTNVLGQRAPSASASARSEEGRGGAGAGAGAALARAVRVAAEHTSQVPSFALSSSLGAGAAVLAGDAAASASAAAPEGSLAASAEGADDVARGAAAEAACGTTRPISSQMAQEIETTVMWVQQLLESVHFIESDLALEPGASLLSIVQPRLRHQKDDALRQSLLLFHEKKEAEKDVDELAAGFRRQALQAVSSQRSSPT